MWQLYIYQDNSGLDPEPEHLGDFQTIEEAQMQVRKDCENAHKTCPEECPDPDLFFKNKPYSKKYNYHPYHGAFFRIPKQPGQRVNIAAFKYVRYYVICACYKTDES